MIEGHIIKGHVGFGTTVRGTALVGKASFSARYDLYLERGAFARCRVVDCPLTVATTGRFSMICGRTNA